MTKMTHFGTCFAVIININNNQLLKPSQEHTLGLWDHSGAPEIQPKSTFNIVLMSYPWWCLFYRGETGVKFPGQFLENG